jgi:hypothetical protein
MQVRIQSTGAVMYEAEFRAYQQANGGPSWDTTTTEVLEALGADVVFEGPQATGGTVYQYSQVSGVEQVDGKWYTKYILGPVFTGGTAAADEAAYKAMKDAEQAKAVREQRTQKLSDSDWTQIADSTADKTAWATYRQALRDITSQAGFPWTITWPNDPNWVEPSV